MITWFLLSLGSAFGNSSVAALSKRAVSLGQYNKITVAFVSISTASILLFIASYIFIGTPTLQDGFWRAILITGSLNLIMFPLTLKSFQYGEFSTAYSMSRATPIFLLLTSWIILKESPPILGMVGVVLTVAGLITITKNDAANTEASNPLLGNILALVVALMASITVNYDKLATIYSNRFFAPACITAFMGLGYATYLLIRHRGLIVKTGKIQDVAFAPHFILSGIALLLLTGFIQAVNNVFHNSALLIGFASYTIAIKRISILFGVIWGWLFFREKNISKKLIGALVAIAGVLLILLS